MMKTQKIEGFIAATLTGYFPDGSINLEIIKPYASMLAANGIAGVFVNGTTGEGKALTLEERMAQAECWVDSAPKGMRVIIHVGYADPADSRALAGHAAEIGAHGIGEVGPDSLKSNTIEALVEYVAATASAASNIPYYYYHMPSVNDLHFLVSQFLKVACQAIPNLAGIKYTHDDLFDFKKCTEYKNGKYDILFGRDEILVEGLKAGAKGAVGSTYNILAPLYQKIVEEFQAGNLSHAQHLQDISAVAIRLLYETGDFGSALKSVLRMIGFDFGGMRYLKGKNPSEKTEALELALQNSGALAYLNKV